MIIGEICNREVITIQREETVLDAARLMRQYHVGSVIVIDQKNDYTVPVGIITDRDLVVEIMATELDDTVMTVGDIMVPTIHTVKESASPYEALELMRQRGIRRLPVVNNESELIGIITLDDVLEILAEKLVSISRIINNEQKKEIKQRP